MSKKLKYIFGAILSLSVLSGCDNKPADSDVPETASAAHETSVTSAAETEESVTSEENVSETETATDTETVTETVTAERKISDEQAALEKLIANTSGAREEYTVHGSIFGDFDGDGRNELVALYGKLADSEGCFPQAPVNELWFASGDKAALLGEAGDWIIPEIVTSCGKALIRAEARESHYFLIKDSAAEKYTAVPSGNWVRPDGEYGDFTAYHHTDDWQLEYPSDGGEGVWFGSVNRRYWYYSVNGECREYSGREIAEDELLKYRNAEYFLDPLFASNGYEVENIIKRGNGVININFVKTFEFDDRRVTDHRNLTALYRNGELFDTAEPSDGGGNYSLGGEKQTDFELFSEMIYDTAEGDENSFIRERFYGDLDSDGKNELYACYGTDENFSLWFADENGAKEITDGTSLFIADGEALLKKSRSEKETGVYDHYIIRDGKSKRLDAYGAKNMIRTENGDFTGIIAAKDSRSDRVEETQKPYWFYYKDGEFRDYAGVDITEEELSEYKGARTALDEISSMGGDLVNIVKRGNGIININYAQHRQDVTLRCFLTLEIDGKGRAKDITPRNEDGTLDNQGWYLHSLKIENQ